MPFSFPQRLSSYVALLLLLWTFNLSAHVKLDYPAGGETFQRGESISIRWTVEEHHGPADWDILFSVDNGISWDTLEKNLPAESLDFQWIIDTSTALGKIRIVQDNEKGSDYESSSPPFTIEPLTTDLSEFQEHVFLDFSISPNPVREKAYFQFYLLKEADVCLEVFDISGSRVTKQIIPHLGKGEHFIPWQRPHPRMGMYIGKVSTHFQSQSTRIILLE